MCHESKLTIADILSWAPPNVDNYKLEQESQAFVNTRTHLESTLPGRLLENEIN